MEVETTSAGSAITNGSNSSSAAVSEEVWKPEDVCPLVSSLLEMDAHRVALNVKIIVRRIIRSLQAATAAQVAPHLSEIVEKLFILSGHGHRAAVVIGLLRLFEMCRQRRASLAFAVVSFHLCCKSDQALALALFHHVRDDPSSLSASSIHLLLLLARIPRFESELVAFLVGAIHDHLNSVQTKLADGWIRAVYQSSNLRDDGADVWALMVQMVESVKERRVDGIEIAMQS
jgi:hypothetical protein